ncbi:MAG TPA: tRNA (adenosine(37)-N6)-threonylcarbamoyltransferase complex transferase subunit TsaD [Actinomycetota bacterium]|nr:tRNA (adenosine(37)-N6)-threonylcarbamoyltransferase complex transferase subunit TsaD [Actinomycetota bacterium]
MKVLGIETSCDETAVAVVEDGRTVLSNLISSQAHLHERFGGVVPEVASRAHLENMNPLLTMALAEAGIWFADIDAVAVTVGPGLAGALLVGLAAAKSVAVALDVPFIGVNHLEGHIYANVIDHGAVEAPYVALLVSGGHTMLVHVPEPHVYEVLGQTLDDAAGEAFDKIARFLGLGFPGGPALDKLARSGDAEAIRFPRALAEKGSYDSSLSGLKTAVVRYVKAERAAGREPVAEDVAASFQEAVVEVQVAKTIAAAAATGVRTILLGGGVVANSRLRELMSRAAGERGLDVRIPTPELCTDNAAMIASAGYYRLASGERTDLGVAASPSLPLSWAPSMATPGRAAR